MIGAAELAPAVGEGKGEKVWHGRRGQYAYYVTHEYPAAPFGWVIVHGEKDLIAAGDSTTHEQALIDLGAELDALASPPAPPPARSGGLVGAVGRLLWGE